MKLADGVVVRREQASRFALGVRGRHSGLRELLGAWDAARGGLDKERLRAEPQAGGVFALAPGWRGLPESRFVLAR